MNSTFEIPDAAAPPQMAGRAGLSGKALVMIAATRTQHNLGLLGADA